MEEQTSAESRSFETVLTDLENCVARLERGNLPLQEVIVLCELGHELESECRRLLDDARLRITNLTESE